MSDIIKYRLEGQAQRFSASRANKKLYSRILRQKQPHFAVLLYASNNTFYYLSLPPPVI